MGKHFEMSLEEVARDVYACLQPDRGLGCSNSGLVNRGGGMVVDTFWDLPHTKGLIEQYDRVWHGLAKRVVNTHPNGDHFWGNQLFEGAEIIGHRLCAEGAVKQDPAALQRRLRGKPEAKSSPFAERLADWDFSGIRIVPPNRLIEDRLEMDLGGIVAHIVYVGPAHTAGDVIVHLPRERVVFSGDILFRLCTPLGWDGLNAKWVEALDYIVSLDPKVVVPGHGPLCGIEGPKEMKAYIQYVDAESRRFFAMGLTPFEAAKHIDLGPYSGWTEPERVLLNIARAYRELRGQSYDQPLDPSASTDNMIALTADAAWRWGLRR
ncbi:MAG: MBL fold metallo-hydrolase [Chloroflexi bacterium]|nr:MBL fold metallo-hydrolase [Chloroflexota bacterium]